MDTVNKIGYLLGHLSGMLHRQSDQALQEQLGLGMSQFKILMALQWNPHAQQRKLALSLGQTEASISRQIKVLHDKGMLATSVNPSERRERITQPTAKGLKITEAAREVLARFHTPLFDELSDKQREQLVESLITLHAHTCQPDKLGTCDHPLGI